MLYNDRVLLRAQNIGWAVTEVKLSKGRANHLTRETVNVVMHGNVVQQHNANGQPSTHGNGHRRRRTNDSVAQICVVLIAEAHYFQYVWCLIIIASPCPPMHVKPRMCLRKLPSLPGRSCCAWPVHRQYCAQQVVDCRLVSDLKCSPKNQTMKWR